MLKPVFKKILSNYKHSILALVLLLFIGVAYLVNLQAQEEPSKNQAQQTGFPDLVGGLKATKGCLGVETAQTGSGKNVIFAWFEDKKAVLRWYYSDMHQEVQKSFFPKRKMSKPLEGVRDDVGPIMAIASITMSDKPQFEATGLPISQIAIELYQPLTGGIFLGGRFAPENLKVKDMEDLTPRKK